MKLVREPYAPERNRAGTSSTARYRGVVKRASVISIVLAVLVLVSAASSVTIGSGLRGKVTLSPASPVCVEDEPCTKPAPGVLLVFRRKGLVAAKVTTTQNATYRARLRPGVYTVTAPAYRRGSGVSPGTVRVRKGYMTRVDLEIDTGIQ